MKLIIQIIGILLVSGIVGGAFHSLRTDRQNKIKFYNPDKYPGALDTGKKPGGTPKPPVEVVQPVEGGTPGTTPPEGGTPQVPAPDPGTTPPAPRDVVEDDSGSGHATPEIDSKQAYAEYEAGGVAFVDARRTKVFEEGHVEGAWLLSLHEALYDEQFERFINENDPGAIVIVYCGGGSCEDSHMVAERLASAGFENVRVMKDGYPGWAKNQFPTATGPEER